MKLVRYFRSTFNTVKASDSPELSLLQNKFKKLFNYKYGHRLGSVVTYKRIKADNIIFIYRSYLLR